MADTPRPWLGRLTWSLVYGLGTQLPVLVAFVWVARHVPPAGFGTMAVAWLVAGVGQVLLLETVGDALVRRAEFGRRDRDTTFWLCLGLGVLLALLTAAAASPAARFFDDVMLAVVLPVLAVRLIFDALAIVPDALLRRSYAVRAVAIRGAAANLAAAVAAVMLAQAGAGVWALVAQQVVLGAVGAAVAWSAAPFLPGLPRARPARDIWAYFAGASLFRSVDYASANLDRFLIGRFRGPTDLGLYAVALRVQFLMQELVVGNALRLVALPLFAQVSGDAVALRTAFLRSLAIVCFVALPSMAGAAVLAGTLIPFAFGETWRPAVPVVQILLLEAMVSSLALLNSALLRALGQPNKWLAVQAIGFVLGSMLVLAAVQDSILLVAVAVLVKALLVFPLHLHLVRRACGFTLRDYLRELRGPAACTVAMVATVMLLEAWLAPRLGTAGWLGAGVMAGALSYAGLMLLFFRSDIRRMLKQSPAPGHAAAGP
jgi:O-antigen/teichoic acid export membrane protein